LYNENLLYNVIVFIIFSEYQFVYPDPSSDGSELIFPAPQPTVRLALGMG